MILACALVAMDMRRDLSGLKAAVPASYQDTPAAGWADLQRFRGERPVRMIGYMMDGDESHPDGAVVRSFVLMPEAGQFLHPAHRIPDEMVEVRDERCRGRARERPRNYALVQTVTGY